MSKYYAVAEAEHACCYGASVRFKHNENDKNEQFICECFDMDTAQMIADALNGDD